MTTFERGIKPGDVERGLKEPHRLPSYSELQMGVTHARSVGKEVENRSESKGAYGQATESLHLWGTQARRMETEKENQSKVSGTVDGTNPGRLVAPPNFGVPRKSNFLDSVVMYLIGFTSAGLLFTLGLLGYKLLHGK